MATEPGSGAAPSAERAKPRASAVERRDRPRERDRDQRDRPRKKRRRPKPPVFHSEAEIGVPDKQTLGMLAVIALVTLVLWGFARGACNYHPPRETRRVRVVKTEEFMRDPKSTAIELFNRMSAANFKGASELASGSAVQDVEREQAACAGNAAACAQRKKNAENVLTNGVLLERDAATATVRVTADLGAGKKPFLVHVAREAQAWKVSDYAPDTGQFKPKPVSSQPSMPFTISTRQVPDSQVPPDVRKRYEQHQAEKQAPPSSQPPP